MIFLNHAEIKTHLYEEVTNEITSDDDSIIQEAIDTAIDEVKGYLSKFNTALIFNPVQLADRNKKLLNVTKDVCVWHLIKLSNPNIEIPIRRLNYDYALEWLQGVQKGTIVPTLPIPTTDTDPVGSSGESDGEVKWKSNPKRNNHY